MPGPLCSICPHPKRPEAELAIARGESVRSVAKRLNLSYQSLDRHQRNCVREAIEQIAQERKLALAESLVDEMERIHRVTNHVMQAALDGLPLLTRTGEPMLTKEGKPVLVPDGLLVLRAVGQARKNLELVARFTGRLEPDSKDAERQITYEEFEALYLRVKRVRA